MRLLQLHVDFIEYELVKKEIPNAEEVPERKRRLEDLVVVFTSVEEGDDERVARRAIDEILESMERLGATRLLIYPYAHLSSRLAKPAKALEVIRVMEAAAKEAEVEVERAPFGWNKAFSLRVKGHPLAEQAKEIVAGEVKGEEEGEVVSKALQLEQKLRSEWFIMEPSGRLVPLSEYDFTGQERLELLAKYEVAKSRVVREVPPHVKLMRRLSLADYEPASDPGNMRYYPKGRLIKSLLETYVTRKVVEYGGVEVETPIMYDFHHPALSSYLHRFPARQYVVSSEDKELFLRFSACFGQFLMAHDAQISYRQLPFRLYELTRYSFRREQRGELVGLRRLRAFTMPDCHALCADLEQAKAEMVKRLKLSLEVLEGIGLGRGDFEMALRFTEDFYREHREFIEELVRIYGRPVLVERWRERFFYFILKWEFNFVDALGKASALSTDQIDVENGERYGITFVDEKGERRHPIILHNSPSGAIERCIYALLEKAYRDQKAGRVPSLPVWLSPTQVRLIPVSSRYLDRAVELADVINNRGFRADVDDRDESVPKRVREAEREWVPYIIVVGEKELSGEELQVRKRVKGVTEPMGLEELLKELEEACRDKPRAPLPLPKLLSMRPRFRGEA
jgi:threonyl-tRNA synthetase